MIKYFGGYGRFLKSYSKEMTKNMRIRAEELHGKDYVKMQLYG